MLSAEESGSWADIAATQSVGLKKDLSFYGILSAGYSISNSWLVVAANLAISLFYGPMNTIWGLIVTTIIYSCVGLTLCELVSAYPTTGGQYHWTSIMAPKRVNRAAVSDPQLLRPFLGGTDSNPELLLRYH